MLYSHNVQSLFFGCLACLAVTSVVNADGRVFVEDLRNSSGLKGYRDAEQACASEHARLASAEELLSAVVECFFSECTRGWLHGGILGTTVCNVVGGSLKAVDVRTENATENSAHLDAFCIKDKAVPCGDPPSFPSARLQEYSGFEMGDELLYTCAPGYMMPGGETSFSLLCDGCGEWYGTVQICVKDQTETHVDYEDKFEDSHEKADHSREDARNGSHEEVPEEAHHDGKRNIEQRDSRYIVPVRGRQHEEHQGREATTIHTGESLGLSQEASDALVEPPGLNQERSETVITAAATEEPVSVLSQKHMFWFPAEAFPEGGLPESTDLVKPTTQRSSGGQSEESKEHNSQEKLGQQHSVGIDDHSDEREDHEDHDDKQDRDDKDDHDDVDDHDDGDDHDDTREHDKDKYDLDHTHEHDGKHDHDRYDDNDSRQEDDHPDLPDDPYRPYDHTTSREDPDDHYDMGEHEREKEKGPHGSREHDDHEDHDDHDDHDDHNDKHHSVEDHDDVSDHDHDDQPGERTDVSKEHPDLDDHDDHDDADDHLDLDDHDDHKVDENPDNDDSHEDHHHHPHLLFPESGRNLTQGGGTKGKGSKSDTWLDGYPISREKTKTSDSKAGKNAVKIMDKPNEVEARRPVTISPKEHGSLPLAPERDSLDKKHAIFPGSHASNTDIPRPSDSPSFSDTLDYDTQQAAPTRSWLDGLTEQPFLDHAPAPPVRDGSLSDGVIGEHSVHNLPGETGERGELEGEMKETICTGQHCPPTPPKSSGRGPKVAAIIVALCAVATAVMVGVWCYRRQQQKSSVYDMKGKGQSQTTQGQQMEMQQKV